MITWRDRHIEKQNELIKGYEESLSLMEALLAFALLQNASKTEDGHSVDIPKKELSEMLGKYKSEVADGETAFTVRFVPLQEPMNGGEQDAG